ncbi:MAG: chemotaxis protein CheA [Chromatiales bacterium]|jgi:two-component system chemotaxis sensor kinase CheA
MGLDLDDEILQDFLVEGGEILEQLNEQLVDLEQTPDDPDLLNAVFRGFHTIKGGAGFLNIEALVEVCHSAEDVFNVLRQGQRHVDPELMDAVLQVIDEVNAMFAGIQEGIEPEHVDPALIQTLKGLAVPAGEAPAASEETPAAETAEPEPEPAAEASAEEEAEDEPAISANAGEALDELLSVAGDDSPPAPGGDDITEEEFENLLDELHGKGKFKAPTPESAPAAEAAARASDSDDITEEEFENLLDELHGKGKFKAPTPEQDEAPAAAATTPAADSDDITEEEFDNLLDELHGKGKFKTPTPAQDKAPAASEPAQDKPAAKEAAAEKPVEKPAAKPKAEPKPKPAAKAEPAKAPAAAGQQKAAPAAETTVRVDTQRLDDIMNMVGELVLVRNRLATLKASMENEAVAAVVSNLDVVTSDLQLAVMKTRMQPIKKVFGRFPRVVRDLARSLKKEIDLEMEGEETDLDKNLVEALADPLVHLVRNSVDHGIEMPDEREKAGKPRKGRVLLSALQEGDHILLSILDDGKGMDAEVLRKLAVERGMMDAEAAARLDNKECYNLIFQPGFSTKKEISDISGRGVGMDVVKTRIAQMNGSVEVDSELGKGSKIIVKLPLTLAILPTLMVVLGEQPFALPLASVVEIFNLDLGKTNVVDGQLTIRVRQRALPLFYLRQWLVNDGIQPDYSEGGGHVVVVNVSGAQVGLVVDHLVGQEEVVIKPLGALLQGLEGMAGATITGDGKIALIMDVPGLMRKYAR